jgi:hypothetical protein
MTCSPTELNSRLTNIDEVILVSALIERAKQEEELIKSKR